MVYMQANEWQRRTSWLQLETVEYHVLYVLPFWFPAGIVVITGFGRVGVHITKIWAVLTEKDLIFYLLIQTQVSGYISSRQCVFLRRLNTRYAHSYFSEQWYLASAVLLVGIRTHVDYATARSHTEAPVLLIAPLRVLKRSFTGKILSLITLFKLSDRIAKFCADRTE